MNKFNLDQLNALTQTTTLCCEKHPDTDFYLYGYYSDHRPDIPTVWNEVTKHCRGLILNGKGEVVERPFPKFWSFKQYITGDLALLDEDRIFKIPKGKMRITEKVDGTMVTLYWIGDAPYLATQRSFTNIKATESTKLLHEKYSHLFSSLNRDYTYVFEAVYPQTKVLIDYGDRRELILIGIIDKKTSRMLPVTDIGFPVCRDFTSEYGHLKSFTELEELNLPNQEGFVVYFENNDMVKIKFPWYKKAHSVLDFFLRQEKAYYKKFYEMYDTLGITYPSVSTTEIINAVDKGLDSILQSIPSFYYLMGFEPWLENELSKVKKALSKGLPEEEIPVETFDFLQRMQAPHVYETSVWNWEKRYLKLCR